MKKKLRKWKKFVLTPPPCGENSQLFFFEWTHEPMCNLFFFWILNYNNFGMYGIRILQVSGIFKGHQTLALLKIKHFYKIAKIRSFIWFKVKVNLLSTQQMHQLRISFYLLLFGASLIYFAKIKSLILFPHWQTTHCQLLELDCLFSDGKCG